MQSNTSPYALQKLNFINTLNLKTCGFFSRSLQHWQLLICITATEISVQKHWIENLPDPHLTHGHTQFVKCKLPSSGLHSYSCWMHSASIPRTPTSLVVCLQGLAPSFSPPNQFISDAPSTKPSSQYSGPALTELLETRVHKRANLWLRTKCLQSIHALTHNF